mgnify:CR=1 FL=1
MDAHRIQADGGASQGGLNKRMHTRVPLGTRALVNQPSLWPDPFEVVAESHQPEVLAEIIRLGVGWTVLPVIQAERGPDGPINCSPLPASGIVLPRKAWLGSPSVMIRAQTSPRPSSIRCRTWPARWSARPAP